MQKYSPADIFEAPVVVVAAYLDACLAQFNNHGRELFDALAQIKASHHGDPERYTEAFMWLDDDIDPGDINPETGLPYAGYSSPALDTSFHDGEDDGYPERCTNPAGHEWSHPESEADRCYCVWCGADGDA